MREIKFRAWEEDAGFEDGVDMRPWTWKEICEMDMGQFFNNPKYKIMQYTGLRDKNGVEIYEGDVLLFNNSINDMNRKWKCVVKYREGSFVCVYPNDDVYNHFDAWNVPKVTWEVIGNIYENLELMP